MKALFAASAFFVIHTAAGPCLAAETQSSLPSSHYGVGGPGDDVVWQETELGQILPVRAQVNVEDSSVQTYSARFYDFGFTIPADATILGIEAAITRYGSASAGAEIRDMTVQLLSYIGIESDNRASSTAWPSEEATAVYGGPSDLWNEAWIPDYINAENFQIEIKTQAVGPAAPTSIDLWITGIEITVTYVRPCSTTLDLTGCDVSFEKASLKVDERTTGKQKLVASLVKGGPLTQTAIGDLTALDGQALSLCIYDPAGALVSAFEIDVAGELCAYDKPCWTSTGAAYPDGKGFSYADTGGRSVGVTKVKLGAGDSAKALVKVANKPGNMVLGTAAGLEGEASATVQIRGEDPALCLSSTLGDVSVSSGGRFQAAK